MFYLDFHTWRRLWVCCTKEWRLRRPQTHCLSWKIGTTYLLCFDAKPNYSSLWFVDCLFLLLSSYPSLLSSPSLFDLEGKWSIFLIAFLVAIDTTYITNTWFQKSIDVSNHKMFLIFGCITNFENHYVLHVIIEYVFLKTIFKILRNV